MSSPTGLQARKLWTSEDLAAHLGVSGAQVRKLACLGELPGFQVGSQWRFDPDYLMEWRHEPQAARGTTSSARWRTGSPELPVVQRLAGHSQLAIEHHQRVVSWLLSSRLDRRECTSLSWRARLCVLVLRWYQPLGNAYAALLLRLCDAALSCPVSGSRLIATQIPSPSKRTPARSISW